jgi:hypothetical protein
MAKQQPLKNTGEEEVARYEQELAGLLQERIKPGLNRGAIPLLARSLAKDIAHWDHPDSAVEDAYVDDEPEAEAEDEFVAGADGKGEAPLDFEDEMRELQAQLGEDWVLSFSVQGDDGWLTAEKDDGSQRVEAQTGAVIREAVELLNEGGGRSS